MDKKIHTQAFTLPNFFDKFWQTASPDELSHSNSQWELLPLWKF